MCPGNGNGLLESLVTSGVRRALCVEPNAASESVMVAGFAFGVVVVAALAGTIGAFLVDERRERAEHER